MVTLTCGEAMRATRFRRDAGVWLSFFALYLQILLPFVVAADLRIIGATDAAGFALCHYDATPAKGDDGTGGVPGSGSGHTPSCCPLCVALGTGVPFTTPVAPVLPMRLASVVILNGSVAVAPVGADTAFHYEARGPPLNN
jgi:hypothetical protein